MRTRVVHFYKSIGKYNKLVYKHIQYCCGYAMHSIIKVTWRPLSLVSIILMIKNKKCDAKWFVTDTNGSEEPTFLSLFLVNRFFFEFTAQFWKGGLHFLYTQKWSRVSKQMRRHLKWLKYSWSACNTSNRKKIFTLLYSDSSTSAKVVTMEFTGHPAHSATCPC